MPKREENQQINVPQSLVPPRFMPADIPYYVIHGWNGCQLKSVSKCATFCNLVYRIDRVKQIAGISLLDAAEKLVVFLSQMLPIW